MMMMLRYMNDCHARVSVNKILVNMPHVIGTPELALVETWENRVPARVSAGGVPGILL